MDQPPEMETSGKAIPHPVPVAVLGWTNEHDVEIEEESARCLALVVVERNDLEALLASVSPGSSREVRLASARIKDRLGL